MLRFFSAIFFLSVLSAAVMPVATTAQIINITIAPPELPVYEQPPLPEEGYIWSPGYWAYGGEGYFWVPGTWALPPAVGLLWTPGYWRWRDGLYLWSVGYWGPNVGFYGGVDYGSGYGGIGYQGGYWNNGVFAYNRAVNNFGAVRVANVYDKTFTVDSRASRASFNGGIGGTLARATPQEEAAAHEAHVAPTALQIQHEHVAATDKSLLASKNHGRPPIAATTKAGEFSTGVAPATGAAPMARLPATNPAGPAAQGSNPGAARSLDENRQAETHRRTLNGGTPPKPLNTAAKRTVAAPRAAVRSAPPPHIASAPRARAAAAPRPAAKSSSSANGKKPG